MRGDVPALFGEKHPPLDSSAVKRLAVVQIAAPELEGSGGASRSVEETEK
jgi:hypothetical protein